ncbi:TetR/AcrR family transcriptional regulator, partial [Bombilactobacillus bombi]|uniref:TetR/AcrR family transcriptional regulator n=1 Tax=Bombilactobacillus bombi TaxID=1303590 RepID=UPI0015E59E07
MGRKISYNRQQVLHAVAQTFVQLGYEATSLDDLVQATHLLRGSLYSAFGSKLGMFVAALRQCIQNDKQQPLTIDMI